MLARKPARPMARAANGVRKGPRPAAGGAAQGRGRATATARGLEDGEGEQVRTAVFLRRTTARSGVRRGEAEGMKVRSGPGISLANANEHPTEAVCSPPGKQRNVNPAKATPAAGLRAHQGMERAPCTGTLASPRRTRLGRAAWVQAATALALQCSLAAGPRSQRLRAVQTPARKQPWPRIPQGAREMCLGHRRLAHG
jgi:hypothetical protein